MNPEQQQAILTLALLAAFADGANDEANGLDASQIMAMVRGA